MLIRKARSEDLGQVRRLAESLDLDYPGMERDRIWVADEAGRVAGIVALMKHPDSDELVALGVEPGHRSKGLGRRLVEALLAEAPDDVHLATIIPGFFERCGFAVIPAAPPGMAKDPAWCEGCPKEKCMIMVRKAR
jgi:N-acetylglutamate synthase-like GNAT family acetyltransferase